MWVRIRRSSSQPCDISLPNQWMAADYLKNDSCLSRTDHCRLKLVLQVCKADTDSVISIVLCSMLFHYTLVLLYLAF
jgi:hypothetical protein